MPRIVFFDDDGGLKWPEDLKFAWEGSSLHAEFGVCVTELVNDPSRLEPMLRDKKDPVDVLFVDLHWGISVNDGIGLLTHARRLAPNLPIVVLTSEPHSAVINECLAAGATAYWNKNDGKLEGLLKVVGKSLRDYGPILVEANSLRKLRDSDERAFRSLAWLDTQVTALPAEILDEVLGWLQQAVANSALNKLRRCSLTNTLEMILTVIAELGSRQPLNNKHRSLEANVLFHLGKWSEAEAGYLQLVQALPTPEQWEHLARVALYRGDAHANKGYRLQQAQELLLSGEHQSAHALLEELAAMYPEDRPIQAIMVKATLALGRDTAPVLAAGFRSFHRRNPEATPDDWFAEIEELEALRIEPAALVSSLMSVIDEISPVEKVLVDWAQNVYLSGDSVRAREIMCHIPLDRISNTDHFLLIAEIAQPLSETHLARHALQYAALTAVGHGREEETFNRCLALSQAISDHDGATNYQKKLLRYWSAHKNFQEIERVISAANALSRQDHETRELAADFLVQTQPDLAKDVYLQLLETPTIRADDQSVIRILRKVLPLDDATQAVAELYDGIKSEWAKTNKPLTLPSAQKPLKGAFIWLCGSEKLLQYQSSLDSILKNNGAKTKWLTYSRKIGESATEAALAAQIKNQATYCILHLAASHSVTIKLENALKQSEVRYSLIEPNQGSSTIIGAVESEYGPIQH